MTDRSDQLDSILCAAVELSTPEERADYIRRQSAGDDELRQQIEELLAAHLRAGDFLESPTHMLPSTIDLGIPEAPGATIGRYKLLEQIGEGGFAVVFMAEQEQPVRRRVAIKIIKAGMDTLACIARFEAERQALAMMDHPSIAKIFDGGATDAGRPYFAMELVKGTPITEYSDQHRLSIADRLALFGQVCDAVQHAHQKGVIHRDLKPSNILVSTQDDRPLAKVIDFGIAKATEARLTDKTLFTDFRQLIGTPAYMSPEQADGSLDIDTRSDVYSLGVLLYELLAGSPPFDPKELKSKAIAEMQRVIREVEPPTPSTRFSTLAAGAQLTRAGERQLDPQRLARRIRGELDWIVMKALEKDRSRRYQSTSELCADLDRYLADKPVEACPPSRTYRLTKYVRRHKAAAAFAAAVATGLIVLAVSHLQTRWERDAKVAALGRATAETAKANEIAVYLGEILGAADPLNANDVNYTVRELLDNSAAGLEDRFEDQPEVEAEIRSVVGAAYRHLDIADEAVPHLQRAAELRRTTVGPRHELYADGLVELGWALAAQGKIVEATKLVEEALAIYHEKSGGPEKQLAALHLCQWLNPSRSDNVVSMAEQLAAKIPSGDNSELASIFRRHAEELIPHRRFFESEALAKRALAMLRRVHPGEHPEIAYALWTLGCSVELQGKYPEAQADFREALAIWHRIYGSRPQMRGQKLFSDALIRVLKVQGKDDEAAAVAEQFRSPSQGGDSRSQLVVDGETQDPVALNSRAWILATLADSTQRNPDLAVDLAAKAIEIEPENGNTWNTLGVAQYRAGQWRSAINSLEKSLAISSDAAAFNYFFLAMAHWRLGDSDEANRLYEQAVDWSIKHDSKNEELRRFRAEAAELMGVIDPAETLARQRETLGADAPVTLRTMHDLIHIRRFEARLDEAILLLEELLSIQRANLEDLHPDTMATTLELLSAYVEARRLAEADVLIEGLSPGAIAKNKENVAPIVHALAHWHANNRRYERSAVLYECFVFGPAKDGWRVDENIATLIRLEYATVLSELDNREAFDKLRDFLIERWGGTTDCMIAERMLRASLLIPERKRDQAACDRWASTAALIPPTRRDAPWNYAALAIYESRRGDYDRALEWCGRCLNATPPPPCVAMAQIVAANVHYKLRQATLAREEWAQIGPLTALDVAGVADLGQGYWMDWLIVKSLIRETEPLFKKQDVSNPSTPTAVEGE